MQSNLLYINFNQLLNGLTQAMSKSELRFPPTDIIKISDERYRIQLAAAGYTQDDITITFVPNGAKSHSAMSYGDRNLLQIEGKALPSDIDSVKGATYLQKGIARRSFQHGIALDERVEVESALMVNGMLTIELKLVTPEEDKPRTIKIG